MTNLRHRKVIKASCIVFDDYSSRRIDYQTFETNLCSQLTPALLEGLKLLGCRNDDQEEKIKGRVKSRTTLEKEGNNSGLKGDFGRIVERLLAPMRRDGIGFQEELEDLNLPDRGGTAWRECDLRLARS